MGSRRNTITRNHESGFNFSTWIQKIEFNLIQVLKWAAFVFELFSFKYCLWNNIRFLLQSPILTGDIGFHKTRVNSLQKCFEWIPKDQYRIYDFAWGTPLNRIRSGIILRISKQRPSRLNVNWKLLNLLTGWNSLNESPKRYIKSHILFAF